MKQEKIYLTPVASTTNSGIYIRKLVVLLMVALVQKGLNNEFMFQYEEVNLLPIVALDVIFHKVLEEVSTRKTKLIEKDVRI